MLCRVKFWIKLHHPLQIWRMYPVRRVLTAYYKHCYLISIVIWILFKSKLWVLVIPCIIAPVDFFSASGSRYLSCIDYLSSLPHIVISKKFYSYRNQQKPHLLLKRQHISRNICDFRYPCLVTLCGQKMQVDSVTFVRAEEQTRNHLFGESLEAPSNRTWFFWSKVVVPFRGNSCFFQVIGSEGARLLLNP